MTTDDDNATTWRGLADQLTLEQIARFEHAEQLCVTGAHLVFPQNDRSETVAAMLDGTTPLRGRHFLHIAIDAHSRLAYSELLAAERKETAAAFWLRANMWFAECGITVRKVLTDGSCYRSHTFRQTLGDIEHRKTSPTDHKPTAKSNDSTAPLPTSGPTPG